MYTMHEDEMLIRDALKVGARGYLLKSEDDAKLLAAVEALERQALFLAARDRVPAG